MSESKLRELSMEFSVDIIELVKHLKSIKETIISNQIGRSGTSIGANIHEAQYAQGKKDFVSKLEIALKEASETGYWLELLLRNIWRCRSNAYTYKFTVCLHNLVDKRWGEWYYFYNKILPFKGE